MSRVSTVKEKIKFVGIKNFRDWNTKQASKHAVGKQAICLSPGSQQKDIQAKSFKKTSKLSI